MVHSGLSVKDTLATRTMRDTMIIIIGLMGVLIINLLL